MTLPERPTVSETLHVVRRAVGLAGKPKHDPKGHYGHAKPPKPVKHEHKGHYGESLRLHRRQKCFA